MTANVILNNIHYTICSFLVVKIYFPFYPFSYGNHESTQALLIMGSSGLIEKLIQGERIE